MWVQQRDLAESWSQIWGCLQRNVGRVAGFWRWEERVKEKQMYFLSWMEAEPLGPEPGRNRPVFQISLEGAVLRGQGCSGTDGDAKWAWSPCAPRCHGDRQRGTWCWRPRAFARLGTA